MPFGSRGPAVDGNRTEDDRLAEAVVSVPGCCHTGSAYRKTRFDGLAEDCGKYRASSALPAAASDPAGGMADRLRLAVR